MNSYVFFKQFLLFICIITTVLVSYVNANEDEIPYSDAQLLVFKRPHLANISQPTKLFYSFKQTGEQEFTDSVSARITQTHEDGTRDLTFDFLTGERKKDYPDINGFRGNPVIMLFLEWDVVKMENTPSAVGSQHFFRNRIRAAFWKHSKVDDIEVTYGDERYNGKRISMRPFSNSEADRKRASIFADKQYEIILVDEIPGELFQISTKLESNEDEAIETTQMTFNQLESLKKGE